MTDVKKTPSGLLVAEEADDVPNSVAHVPNSVAHVAEMTLEELYHMPPLPSFEAAQAEIESEEQGRHIPTATDDEEQAERYLEWLRYRNGKIDSITRRMDAEIAVLEHRKEQLLKSHLQRVEYLEASLKKHLWESGKKRLDYAYGTLTRRKGRERVVIEDESAFCFKHGDTPYVATTTTRRPDKAGIKDHITSTGEIPDGADLVRGDDTCTITLTTEANL